MAASSTLAGPDIRPRPRIIGAPGRWPYRFRLPRRRTRLDAVVPPSVPRGASGSRRLRLRSEVAVNRGLLIAWREGFLWSGASFVVAASAGAFAAVVIERGESWKALLMLVPVGLTFLTYQLFVAQVDVLKNERAAREGAEQADRLKNEFLAIVSHELRTPLNAILGWSDLLRRGTMDSHRRDRAYRSISDAVQRQAQLIDELLDVARIMSGKIPLEPSVVDVPTVVEAALSLVRPAAGAKRVSISMDVESAIGAIVADRARIQQIAWNLLTNAVKFSPEGGSVNVQIRKADGCVELAVADAGHGIAREFLPLLFEPFRQADTSTTRRHGGMGLGLSIVKHLAEAHGGTVSAESDGEGRGARFVVRLPAAPAGCTLPY